MRSEDLRPLGPRTWATLSDAARAALDAYDIKPAPFELEGQEPTAVILQWNDPRPVVERRRAYRAQCYKAQKEKRPASTTPQLPEQQQLPPLGVATPPVSGRSSPRNDKLARELAGLSSMSASKIAAFCNLPVAEVEAMRASREHGV